MEYALLYAEGVDALPYVPADDNIGEWVDDIVARGIAEFGMRLRPGVDATTVRVRKGELLVSDGPFTESKESVGGFDIIDARDLDEAIEVASKHPVAGFGRVEVRPFVQWPGAKPGARIVPAGLHERPAQGRQYVLFVGRDPDELLSLTRKALEALLANGLIAALDEDSVVQRAVDTLISDLDGG